MMVEEKHLTPLEEATYPLFLGVSFGGKFLKIGIVDSDARTISYFAAPTESGHGPESSTQAMASAILQALEKTGLKPSDITGAGLAFPGSMDPQTNRLHRPPNYPDWKGFPITERLTELTGLPSIRFSNNANASAYGESWIGAGKGTHSLCLLELERGIGCGIIVEGREVAGANGYGGEFGHMIVDSSPGARWCNCQQQGHLEAYVSATGVARRTRELLEIGLKTSLQERINHDTALYDIPRMVYEEAVKGDPLANEIIMETGRVLGVALVTLVHTIDPACILIGGEMMFGGKGSEIGEKFLERAREEIRARAFKDLSANLNLDFATLGSYASYIGAAGLAREETFLFAIAENENSNGGQNQ